VTLTNAQAMGRVVAMIRAGRGIKQKQLAKKADFDASYISLIERGDRALSMAALHKVAAVLKVSEARLFELQAEFLNGGWKP
jgi:transcriptional regulator with XRE-family HTH domain